MQLPVVDDVDEPNEYKDGQRTRTKLENAIDKQTKHRETHTHTHKWHNRKPHSGERDDEHEHID